MAEILIVDDDRALRRWEARVLEGQSYTTLEAANAAEARDALGTLPFELALVDFNMPGESGLDLLSHIRVEHPSTSVLMITGEDDMALATKAIERGAYGYMVKPIRAGELLINVTNALHRRRREMSMLRRLAGLESGREALESALRDALAHDGDAADAVRVLESDELQRLVRLAEFRDEQTGRHLVRMSRTCELLGRAMGHDDEWCARLRVASELHDVGKVAIPDRILLKPGGLTAEERAIMETHAEIGYRLLSDSTSELMRLAASTALTHHERWDGTGYPRQLRGADIPIEGRIAAVADVFDALTSDRVYRPAVPFGMAAEMMEAERGHHFDPAALDAFGRCQEEIAAVRSEYGGD